MPIPSDDAAKRIRRSVKHTENQRPNRVGPQRSSNPIPFLFGIFRITTATQDGDNKRWQYTAKRLGSKSTAGYGGTWNDDPNDTDDYTLFALSELINSDTGTYGNGVTQASLDAINDSGGGTDGTHDLQPIPDDHPVFAVGLYLDDGSLEWWILPNPNGVDGECPVPS